MYCFLQELSTGWAGRGEAGWGDRDGWDGCGRVGTDGNGHGHGRDGRTDGRGRDGWDERARAAITGGGPRGDGESRLRPAATRARPSRGRSTRGMENRAYDPAATRARPDSRACASSWCHWLRRHRRLVRRQTRARQRRDGHASLGRDAGRAARGPCGSGSNRGRCWHVRRGRPQAADLVEVLEGGNSTEFMIGSGGGRSILG